MVTVTVKVVLLSMTKIGPMWYNVTKRKKFPVFRLVSNPEHLVFEKNMLFTSPKQLKATITEYVVNGG